MSFYQTPVGPEASAPPSQQGPVVNPAPAVQTTNPNSIYYTGPAPGSNPQHTQAQAPVPPQPQPSPGYQPQPEPQPQPDQGGQGDGGSRVHHVSVDGTLWALEDHEMQYAAQEGVRTILDKRRRESGPQGDHVSGAGAPQHGSAHAPQTQGGAGSSYQPGSENPHSAVGQMTGVGEGGQVSTSQSPEYAQLVGEVGSMRENLNRIQQENQKLQSRLALSDIRKEQDEIISRNETLRPLGANPQLKDRVLQRTLQLVQRTPGLGLEAAMTQVVQEEQRLAQSLMGQHMQTKVQQAGAVPGIGEHVGGGTQPTGDPRPTADDIRSGNHRQYMRQLIEQRMGLHG